jgi:hypothetical protein
MAVVPIATRPSEATVWLQSQPPGPVINLPLGGPVEPLYQYESTFHWRPMLNGYSGSAPSSYVAAMPVVGAFPSDVALDKLRSAGVAFAIVHERHYGREAYRRIVAAASARSDLVAYGPFADEEYETRVYRILKSG